MLQDTCHDFYQRYTYNRTKILLKKCFILFQQKEKRKIKTCFILYSTITKYVTYHVCFLKKNKKFRISFFPLDNILVKYDQLFLLYYHSFFFFFLADCSCSDKRIEMKRLGATKKITQVGSAFMFPASYYCGS